MRPTCKGLRVSLKIFLHDPVGNKRRTIEKKDNISRERERVREREKRERERERESKRPSDRERESAL